MRFPFPLYIERRNQRVLYRPRFEGTTQRQVSPGLERVTALAIQRQVPVHERPVPHGPQKCNDRGAEYRAENIENAARRVVLPGKLDAGRASDRRTARGRCLGANG